MEQERNLELQERGNICLKDLEDMISRLFLENEMGGKIVAYRKNKTAEVFNVDVERFDVEIDIINGVLEGVLGHHYEDAAAERKDAFLITKDVDGLLIIQNIEGAEEKIAWMKLHLPFER